MVEIKVSAPNTINIGIEIVTAETSLTIHL